MYISRRKYRKSLDKIKLNRTTQNQQQHIQKNKQQNHIAKYCVCVFVFYVYVRLKKQVKYVSIKIELINFFYVVYMYTHP